VQGRRTPGALGVRQAHGEAKANLGCAEAEGGEVGALACGRATGQHRARGVADHDEGGPPR
jgi:hypothetical protein